MLCSSLLFLLDDDAERRNRSQQDRLPHRDGGGAGGCRFGADAFSFTFIFILLGAAAIGAAITYTAGKMPYGYVGLGDLFVLIFFGWVGVIGSYFVQTTHISWLLMFPATACGLLAVAVLNVNNIRDLESDRLAGKRSIPVRLGLERARVYHWTLLITATLFATAYVLIHYISPWQFLFLLAVPLLARNGLAISRTADLPSLNPWLKTRTSGSVGEDCPAGQSHIVGHPVSSATNGLCYSTSRVRTS